MSNLFSTTGLMPHIHCYLSRPALVWTMFTTDFVIGLAYFGISLTLWGLIRRIQIPFSAVVFCFGIFIGACGLTHLMEDWTLWKPDYWWSAAVKAITAIASIGTAIYLLKLRHPIITVTEAAKLSEQRRLDLEALTKDLKTRVEERARDLQKDIAERKRFETALIESERKLAESEGLFRAVANSIPQLAWMTDSTGYIIWYNQNWYDYTGTTLKQMQGWGWQAVHHPDYAAKVLNKWIHHLHSGEPWEDTFPLRSQKGEWRWFLSRARPIRDETGKIARWFGSNTDITDLRDAESAIKASEAKYRSLFENMTEEVHLWKIIRGPAERIETWHLVDANPAALRTWNKKREEVIGRSADEILGPGSTQHLLPIIEKIMQEHSSHTFEDYFAHLDRYFRFTSVPMGESFLTTGADITQIKKTEEKLRESLQARDEFLSIASHELKTPLASLKLQSQIFQRGIQKGDTQALAPDRIQKLVDQTERQTSRLTRLVDDMLDMARIRSGKLAINKEGLSLSELIGEVVARLDLVMKDSGTPVDFISTEQIEGFYDRFRIEQVVSNLLTNAMRYGERKPVHMRLSRKDGHAILAVQDHGRGIEKAAQGRIFNRFERAISPSEVSGLGLGLFISRQIVQAHGGKIWVESKGRGYGSTFYVELPIEPIETKSLKKA